MIRGKDMRDESNPQEENEAIKAKGAKYRRIRKRIEELEDARALKREQSDRL
jgi:hypothetical protein